MKKFLCIFLSFLMLFSFVACNEDTTIGDSSSTTSDLLDNVATTAATTDVEEEATNKCDFYAGYARAKITPTEFPALTGQDSYAYRVLEDIYATCVAFSDTGGTGRCRAGRFSPSEAHPRFRHHSTPEAGGVEPRDRIIPDGGAWGLHRSRCNLRNADRNSRGCD